MSADNWTTCPKCEAIELNRVTQLKLKAGAAYGKVSSEEYLRLLTESEKPPKVAQQFREDYQIGIHAGEFTIEYRGHCKVCDLSFKYDHNEKLKL